MSGSIINVILPKIGVWAGVGMGMVEWAVLVSLIASSAGLLTAGSLGDMFGHRTVYLVGSLVVGLGSLGCAIASNFNLFLAFRALQGLGASALMASSPALITLNVEQSKRGRSLGLISTATYVGLTIAPPIGGILDTLWSFRAVFWMQTISMFLLCLIGFVFLPKSHVNRTQSKVDFIGATLIAIGLSGATLMIAKSNSWGFPEIETCLPLIVGMFGLIGFVWWELRVANPVFDIRLLRNRMLFSAFLGAFLHYFAVFMVTFLLPFYLVDILGLSTGQSGVYLTIMPMVMALSAWPSGYLSDIFGSRVLSAMGMYIVVLSLFLLLWTTEQLSSLHLISCLAILGLGTGMFVSPNTNALLSATPIGQQGMGGGLLALTRNLGMLIGTAVSAATFETTLTYALSRGMSDISSRILGLHSSYMIGMCVAFIGGLVVLMRPPKDEKA